MYAQNPGMPEVDETCSLGGYFDEVGSDSPDQDPVEPGHQWVDTSGEIPPPGAVFYYGGAAYDSVCSAEGPW